MGSTVQKVANVARDTASFFTGGTSGVNVFRGERPTPETVGADIAGLGAGFGAAGASIGGTAAASTPSLATAATVLSAGTGVAGAGAALQKKKEAAEAAANELDALTAPIRKKKPRVPNLPNTGDIMREAALEAQSRKGRASTILTESLGS